MLTGSSTGVTAAVHRRLFWLMLVSLVCIQRVAWAQLDNPTESSILENLSGSVLSAPGAPIPEPGDQIAAVFGGEVVGLHVFLSSQSDPLAYSMDVFGDDPDTNPVEGPRRGQRIQFQYFDSSTNSVRSDVAVVNDAGEVVNIVFEGDVAINFPIDIPGVPQLPGGVSRTLDILIGAQVDTGGGAGVVSEGSFDVDGDGKVTKLDAAIILRLVTGARGNMDQAIISRADVNGDGVINTRDAIDLLRSR